VTIDFSIFKWYGQVDIYRNQDVKGQYLSFILNLLGLLQAIDDFLEFANNLCVPCLCNFRATPYIWLHLTLHSKMHSWSSFSEFQGSMQLPMLIGCQQDNTSHIHLLIKLLLKEYSLKYAKKNPLKNLSQIWIFFVYLYVNMYGKDFKKDFIFKQIETHLQVHFVFNGCSESFLIIGYFSN
jgi:hypothetical protein